MLSATSSHKLSTSVWTYVAFTGLTFGAGALLVKKLTNDGIDPFTITWIPFLISGALALGTGYRRNQLSKAAVFPGILLGVLAGAGPSLIFNYGFDKLPAGIVTLLISLGPIFTAIVAHFVFDDERFNSLKGAGLVLAYGGVMMLTIDSVGEKGSLSDILIVLAGSALGGSAGVLVRYYSLRHEPMALIAPNLFTAGIVALILTYAMDMATQPSGGFAAWHFVALFFFGITTFLAFLAIFRANQLGTTGQVSVIGYFLPLFGVIGGMVFFKEDASWPLLVGGMLIVVSMGLIGRGSKGLPTVDSE